MSQITSKGATGPLALQASGSFQTSTDANLATLLGTRWDLSDGREVIFVSTSTTASATAGHLMQDAALVSAHQTGSVGTFTAYSNNGNIPASAIVTIGATAMTANQYQGGLFIVTAGSGIGQTLRIAGNTAAVSSGTQGVITFEDAPAVALDSTTTMNLVPAHGKNVVDFPTTPTNVPAGVCFYPIPAGSYGFLTSKGLVGALSDATVPTVGASISPSTTTAGRITLSSVALVAGSVATVTKAVIGSAAILGVSAESHPVFINV